MRVGLSPAWLVASDCNDADQLGLCRRIFGRALPRLRLGPSAQAPFGARIVLSTRPTLGLASCFEPRERWEKEPSAEENRIMLVRPADGPIQVSQGGHTVTVEARGAVLISDAATAHFISPG
jgi:hypothetical protein